MPAAPVVLYYVPRTRAIRPRWILEELDLPYRLVRLDPAKGETRTPEHLARQPLGHVPALEDGDLRMFESAAICLYLAERYGAGALLPPSGSAERAAVYQWALFVATELEPALAQVVVLTHGKPEPDQDRDAVSAARARVGRVLLALDAALGPDGFLAGGALSVADVLLASIQSFPRAGIALRDSFPAGAARLRAYLERLAARPAFQRAIAD